MPYIPLQRVKKNEGGGYPLKRNFPLICTNILEKKKLTMKNLFAPIKGKFLLNRYPFKLPIRYS